ncbi:MAG: ferredoxin--NADP reductase [Shewanella sp.]|nr:ferredoxin--NADP reductase [Shewanella sp.]MCF1430057.1 ferredoxin--NADP reductase [Shewanella sp.]MCF1438120.1 ferredoxin--NADP reductase [Shewanella sp.]MCF1458552.1 ferredoxin--NADP reductase [Shewanella sp.]
MWTGATVIERIDWNDKLFTLRLKAGIEPFIAGQFIKLSQVRDKKRIARAYSLVNPPGTQYLEVLAVHVEDGLLSPALHTLNAGDIIDISPRAAGFMTLDELPADRGKHLWLLATGTAVGPFISMLKTDAPWQRFEKVVLVYGVRLREDLAYWQSLNELAASYPGRLVLIPCVTREEMADGLSCRIPDGLENGSIEALAGININPTDSQVMICGNPGMVADSLTWLQGRGLTKNLRRAPGQITMEKYW